LNNATQKIRELESQANALKGEKIAHSEKIKSLDEALSETLDEKYRLHRELKETEEAMSEFRSTLADTKLRAKKSFYKGVEEKKAGNNHE
jgi:chromosome segregation ATPase